MKICFVDNLLLTQTASGFQVEPQPHLGLISLIAVARAGGHEAALYDPKLELLRGDLALGPRLYGTAAERILADAPDVIGFTSLGCNFACTMRIAEEIRARRSDIPILLGGPHASILDREILERYSQFDVVVRSEGELVLCDALAAVAGNGSLSGCRSLTFRNGGKVCRTADAPLILDLDALPAPAYDAYPIAELNLSWLNVEAGRGCPFHCTFCSTASFFGRRYRLKSAQKLVSDLDGLCATYGIREFMLNHDLFTVNKVKVREFCTTVAARKYAWTCSARIDCVDDSLLEEMRNAGCVGIYYGIETGSQTLQQIVSKNLDLSLYKPIIESSLRLGMKATASFITGYPNETEDDQEATLRLIDESIKSYDDRVSLQLHLLTPEPGTSLLDEFRHVLRYDGYVSDFNLPVLDSRDAVAVIGDSSVFVCQRYYAAGCDRLRNIAIAEGFRALYGLGHALLRLMSETYQGTFLDMLLQCGIYARQSHLDHGELIVAFISQHWGTEHPLYDICKYIDALTRIRPDNAPRVANVDMTTPIRLARCVVPVGYTRNGHDLAGRLYSGSALDSTDSRNWHVLIADAGLRSHALLPLDSVTYEILLALQDTTTKQKLIERFKFASIETRLWSLGLLGTIVPTAGDEAACPDAPPSSNRAPLHRKEVHTKATSLTTGMRAILKEADN